MAQDTFHHLPLPLKIKDRAYLTGGGDYSDETQENRKRRVEHGARLKGQATKILDSWKQNIVSRQQNGLGDLPQALPMLLQIDPNTDPDFLRSFGFEIVSEQDDGYIVIATEDIDLNVFLNKLDKFARNLPRSGSAASIHYMYGGDNLDLRLQRILSDKLYMEWAHIQNDQIYIVDVGIECIGTLTIPEPIQFREDESESHFRDRYEQREKKIREIYIQMDELKMKRETQLEQIVYSYGGEIVSIIEEADSFASLADSFTVRISIKGQGLRDIAINFPFVFEVIEPEEVSVFTSRHDAGNDMSYTVDMLPPAVDAPKICIIDSGILEGHILLSPAIDSAASECFLPGETDVSDHVGHGGHGTRVAGAVLYPAGIPKSGIIKAPFWIQNARVLNDRSQMPKSLFPPTLVKKIIKKYYFETNTRIYNHSITGFFPYRLQHMSSWPAEMDNLSYELDVIFIQAAGNIRLDHNGPFRYGIKQHISAGRDYPNYLLEQSCRIPSPAQSLQSLTVGSVSHSDLYEIDRWALGTADRPSAFSATGLGIWDTVKPDVVEYGGTYAKDNGNPAQFTTPPEVCPELLRSSPPVFARDGIGTSFAAPKVAHIVATIQQVLPDEPTILYRALVAQSARWPDWALAVLSFEQKGILRHLGYGIPNVNRAITNSPFRVTLITSGRTEIFAREAHIYEVPIPRSIRSFSEDHDILIEITLSYVAKPRRTRKNRRGYLSTWLDWKTSNIGESSVSFTNRVLYGRNHSDRDDESSISWVIGNRSDVGIKGVARNSGTLQKDWVIIKSHDLTDGFNIAVIGHPGWNKDLNIKAHYSLVVSFEALNQDVQIYNQIKSEIEAVIDTQIETEIETEILNS